MRKLTFGLTLIALLLSAWPAGACGDKLLVLGQGVRFQPERSLHPASILLYMNPDVPYAAAMGDTQLRAIMDKAGHRYRSVRTREELNTALKTYRYDIVLADYDDAVRLEQSVQDAGSQPVLLPWIAKGTNTDVAKKRYRLFFNAPGKPSELLSLVDRTMEDKPKLVRLGTGSGSKQVSELD